MHVKIRQLSHLLIFAIGVGLFIISTQIRSPLLFKFRVIDAQIIGMISVLLFSLYCSLYNKNKKTLFSVILSLYFLVFLTVIHKEVVFSQQRNFILSPTKETKTRLSNIGGHFIVGYRELDEMRALAMLPTTAGIFMSNHNFQGKTKEDVKQEVDDLQNIRKDNNLPPLIVTTDQEGGLVSRATPPLPYQESLRDVPLDQVEAYALEQASELASIGVTVNFAPVVDLDLSNTPDFDLYTHLSKRALSQDPRIVTEKALLYSKTLAQYGITPTLKHFPGLGRTNEDTHLSATRIETSIEELEATDWVPFRTISSETDSWIMLGHVYLDNIDKHSPASFSHVIVNDILRNSWGYRGTLVTDDFSMGAVYNSPDGVVNASRKALDAGVDYILLSYDYELIYPILYNLQTTWPGGDAAL